MIWNRETKRKGIVRSVHSKQNSEVARLLAQIDREYEAAQLGLSGLSQGSSQHQFINSVTERIGMLHSQLHHLVGDEAMVLISIQSDHTTSEEKDR